MNMAYAGLTDFSDSPVPVKQVDYYRFDVWVHDKGDCTDSREFKDHARAVRCYDHVKDSVLYDHVQLRGYWAIGAVDGFDVLQQRQQPAILR